MFQYACGRALALRNENDDLKLDISGYSRQHPGDAFRTYSLSNFAIAENIADENEIVKAHYPFGTLSKYTEIFRKKILRQFNVGFVPYILRKKTAGRTIYLDGFWQSEKYFADFADDIRREFTLKKPLGVAARTIANAMDSRNGNSPSVSIHIRRGDIVDDGGKSGLFGIATPEYYSRALIHVAEKLTAHGVKNFRVFVFSDDIEWTKKNLVIPYPTTYVSGTLENGKPAIADYEEIILMSLCSHNIIANSSFSWWGAWLNKNPEKIVIAPIRWSTNHENWHTETVPVSWIRI